MSKDRQAISLTKEEALDLCEKQYKLRGGCDNCKYKLFELKVNMPQDNYRVEGYSVCILNAIVYLRDRNINLETGEITMSKEYEEEQAEIERLCKESEANRRTS